MSKRFIPVTVRWLQKDKLWKAGSAKGRYVAYYETKGEAVSYGRELAKKLETELIVFNKDGRIAWRNSYGNDRRDRKG